MAEITIRYTGKVAGHPEPNSQVTVEHTALVEALLAGGYVVEVDPPLIWPDGVVDDE